MRNQSGMAIGIAALSISSAGASAQQQGMPDLRMPPLPSLNIRTPENPGISDQQAMLATQSIVSNAGLRFNREPRVAPATNGAAGLSYVATVAGHHATIHSGSAISNGNVMTAAMTAMGKTLAQSADIVPDGPSLGESLVDGAMKAGQAAATAAILASADGGNTGARRSHPTRGPGTQPAPMPRVMPSQEQQAPVLAYFPKRTEGSDNVAFVSAPESYSETGPAIQQASWPVVAGALGGYLADKAWSEGARRFPRLGEADCKIGAGIGYGIDALVCPPPPGAGNGMWYHDPQFSADAWKASRECQQEALDQLKHRWNECSEEADAKIKAQQKKPLT